MKINFARIACYLIAMSSILPAFADDKPQKAEDFRPYKLIGDWKFVNSNSGRNYGGDIEVTITSIDGNGIMRGRISYDGRQTNDQCSTKELFSDKPVEAEIIKTNNEYRITFQVNCSTGISPRVVSWTLVCEQATCSRPDVQPWGKGLMVLRESR